jgi:two-component system, OmpR family, alkaline phosphatase synthesis response regulator PhoP
MEGKVLIVDDEAYIRLLLEQTLEELEDQGVQLMTSDNGQDGLKIIQEEQPDLVFLDVMMPKMNGFDVCRTVKKDLGMDGVTIVLLTAKGQEYDRQKGEDSGADLYMTKPFDPDELLELAERVLAG